MVYAMEAVLKRYGNLLLLRKEGVDTPFRGFLQRSHSKSLQNSQRVIEAMGQISRGQYVLLAPLEPIIREGDIIVLGELQVNVRTVEIVMVGNRAVYRWGLCEKER